ncbi:diguanylate cyclase, partial [Pseudomonas syringae]
MSDSVLTEVLLNLCQLTGSKYAKVLGGAACNWRTEASIGVADEQFGEDLLRNIISYGEVVVINPGTAFSYSLQFANRSHSFVCIALRVGKDELCGAIILGGSPKDLQLSSAIRYLIQIHAARASSLLHQNSGAGVEDMTTVNLDRLRLLESVVINAKDAILITETGVEEPAPKIIYCNPSFLKVTGYSLAEVIGSTPRMLQCERTDRAALNKIRIALQSWRPVEVELINCRKDGSYFWVELSIVPVADENGWYTHWVSVQRDISDRKNSEVASALAIKEREERLALESRLKEREVMTKHLSFIAFHDELTSLCNRVYMMSQLSQLFAANCSQRIKATLILIDLDGFKLINDSMGYLSGDTLLKNVASRLQSCLRGNDVLARIGGDEFSILLCGEDQRGVSIALAERIVERLQQQIKIDDQEVFISCSIGIVVANKFHNKPEDLLRDADVAMY